MVRSFISADLIDYFADQIRHFADRWDKNAAFSRFCLIFPVRAPKTDLTQH